jgi:hypothetical protein
MTRVPARGWCRAACPVLRRSDTCTLKEIFAVSPWLGDAANATNLRDLFITFP